MKKCPYCHTLMKDDAKVCPKCLKDASSLLPMKRVAPKDNQFNFYSLVFGLIISIGSVFASISQRGNRLNYQTQYDEILRQYNEATASNIKEELASQGEALMANIKTCQFREIAFYVMCGIGGILVLWALISYLIIKIKKNKQKAQ
jgi:hypothetical protein